MLENMSKDDLATITMILAVIGTLLIVLCLLLWRQHHSDAETRERLWAELKQYQGIQVLRVKSQIDGRTIILIGFRSAGGAEVWYEVETFGAYDLPVRLLGNNEPASPERVAEVRLLLHMKSIGIDAANAQQVAMYARSMGWSVTPTQTPSQEP